MRQDNKLNKALKGALGEHTEPLHDGQWERLSAVLGEKKKKNRFLPWFMLLCIVGVSGLILGYWLGGNNAEKQVVLTGNPSAGNSHTGTGSKDVVNGKSSQSGQESSDANTNKDNSKTGAGNGRSNMTESASGKDLHAAEPVKRNRYPHHPVRPGNRNAGDIKNENRSDNSNALGLYRHQGHNFATDFAFIDKQYKTLAIKRNINQEIEEVTGLTVVDHLDSLELKKKKLDTSGLNGKNNHGPVNTRARFVVGFATGFSVAQFTVKGITHPEKLHQDARTIYDENNKSIRSQFFNLSFEWYPFKHLGLNFSTGMQYRKLNQDINFDYKLTQIPFRDIDGTIVGYLQDSNALVFKIREKNTYNFVNVPLRIGYSIPIGVKQEIGVSAGVNMSFMTGLAGKSFLVDEKEERPLNETYKKRFNMGYSGGLFYSRNLYRHWWIGLELQWQSTSLNYVERYATIRSSLHVKSYNCALRYKF